MICWIAKYSRSKQLQIIPAAEQYQASDSQCYYFLIIKANWWEIWYNNTTTQKINKKKLFWNGPEFIENTPFWFLKWYDVCLVLSCSNTVQCSLNFARSYIWLQANYLLIVIVYIKMITDFLSFFIHFSLMTIWSRAQANHKRVEKYIFYCFGDECCPKWDFEKLTIASITRCQSLYNRDLIASLTLYWQPKVWTFNPGHLIPLKGSVQHILASKPCISKNLKP